MYYCDKKGILILKIAIDAFGGDNAPLEIVKGAITSVNLIDDVEIVLVGDQTKIQEILDEYGYKGNKIEILHATEIITNDEAPTVAIRTKKNSSIVVGLNALKERLFKYNTSKDKENPVYEDIEEKELTVRNQAYKQYISSLVLSAKASSLMFCLNEKLQ